MVTRVQPDLAIEILSPGTASNDRGRKMRLLARHGVREFWLVDPDAVTIEVYASTGNLFVLAGAWVAPSACSRRVTRALARISRSRTELSAFSNVFVLTSTRRGAV